VSKRSRLYSQLPERPVGVRRSWRKLSPDLAEIGERLRTCSVLVKPEWGNPVEAYEYRERKGALRRIEARYDGERRISISFRRDGTRIERTCLYV